MEKMTLTVKEMAGVLGVSLPVAYDLTEREDFPLLRIGKKKLVPRAALESWMNEQVARENASA